MLKVLENCKAPTKGSEFSAGVDLYASEDCIIGAGETKIIGLGVCIDYNLLRKEIFKKLPAEISYFPIEKQDKIFNEFLTYHCLELHLQNSIRAKGLISGVEIIGLYFEDEIKIIIHNPLTSENLTSDDNRYINDAFIYSGHEIKRGEKIAQILLKEHQCYLFGVESDEVRNCGFGSIGK